MQPAKVVLFTVAFCGCASVIASALVPILSALKHSGSNLISREFSRPAALRRFPRASPHNAHRGGTAKPYSFRYFINDGLGNYHFRDEYADETGTVIGNYGISVGSGRDQLYRTVNYTADSNGFRAKILTNEPTLVGQKSPADVRLNDDDPERKHEVQHTVGGQNSFSAETPCPDDCEEDDEIKK